MTNSQPWGGRFREGLAEAAFRFSASLDVDGRLFREDIAGSIAHAQMLADCGIISAEDGEAITNGLIALRADIEAGRVEFPADAEDIHMAVEKLLIERIGPAGGRLHTARSRNDQVALDIRLYLRRRADELVESIRQLQRALLRQAELHAETVMPGYTHLQRAQPVLLGHHLLAYLQMLERDRTRLLDCQRRADTSPLGAAALAGTSFPIDRHAVAANLGFAGIVENSMDAVSTRDHVMEFVAACSIGMCNLSRLAEEVILWATTEFHFIEIGDAFSTGSSIMPQKKNPDMAELVRGKTGQAYGALISLLTTMKGLPLSYNRDMQEDKRPMFQAADTWDNSLSIMAGMLDNSTFNASVMQAAAAGGFSTATEIADYLVRCGTPFRDAHGVAGAIVGYCVQRGLSLVELDLPTLQTFSPAFASDIFDHLDPNLAVQQRRSAGGASPQEVARQVAWWKGELGSQ